MYWRNFCNKVNSKNNVYQHIQLIRPYNYNYLVWVGRKELNKITTGKTVI